MVKRFKTGGRIAGTPNRSTAEIKTVAQEYGPAAVKRLAELAGLVAGIRPAESEQAQVAASKEILDRGFGRCRQPIGDETYSGPIVVTWWNGTRL
jgi:hypothetical protein